MIHTLSLIKILPRPIIRDNFSEEWMNKMTDEEMNQWEEEVDLILEKENISKSHPDYTGGISCKGYR